MSGSVAQRDNSAGRPVVVAGFDLIIIFYTTYPDYPQWVITSKGGCANWLFMYVLGVSALLSHNEE